MRKKNTLISGALYLGVGTFIAKLLGAFYRVPLTNMIGGLGLGLYQMVFPVYSLLLDFSGAGLPSALSRLISSKTNQKDTGKRLFINSIRIFLCLGIICSLIMAIFCRKLARLQGNEDAYLGYLFLSPAIVFVSLISCFRGYFQGNMDMKPTAISQVVEQVVKLVLGITFVKIFLPNLPLCVGGATLAITISEIFALLILISIYKRKKIDNEKTELTANLATDAKLIIKTTFPITLVGIMIPLSQVIDSFLTINILSKYTSEATLLYGLLSGVVITVINLPVSVCYGISTVAIPSVSSSRDEREKEIRIKKAIILTLIIALPCSIFLWLFAPFTINLLFHNLQTTQKQIAVKLLSIASPCVVLLSLLQTSNAILIGKGRLYMPVFSLMIGIIVKTILNITLLKIPQLNIYGGVIAIIACYFVTCLINLVLIFTKKVKNEDKQNYIRRCVYQK